MENIQENLIQSYTSHFHDNLKLGPLQAKIMAYILIKGKNEGLTFEDILNYTQASKSSVSTSLNCLIDRNSITFFFKPQDRKKYFIPIKLSSVLERTQHIIQTELTLLADLIAYHDKFKESLDDINRIDNMQVFKKHLEKIEVSVQETLNQIK